MKALYEHYDKLMREAKESTEKGYETIAKKKQSIRRLEKQIEKIEQTIYRYPSWVKEVLIPLADRISERLGYSPMTSIRGLRLLIPSLSAPCRSTSTVGTNTYAQIELWGLLSNTRNTRS